MKQNTVPILSLTLPVLTEKTALSRILCVMEQKRPTLVFTPNTAMLHRAWKDPAVAKLLRSADLLLPDGSGILAASRFLGTPLPCRLSGIDVAERILALAAGKGLRVFFLGGRPGVAEEAAERLKKRYPALTVCGTHHGYFDHFREETESVIQCIRDAKPQILFVCLGFPKQEAWLLKNKNRFPTLRLGMGLGGSLDVWSGKSKRAPKLLQELGLEWLWRSLREPHRFSILCTLPSLAVALTRQKIRVATQKARR